MWLTLKKADLIKPFFLFLGFALIYTLQTNAQLPWKLVKQKTTSFNAVPFCVASDATMVYAYLYNDLPEGIYRSANNGDSGTWVHLNSNIPDVYYATALYCFGQQVYLVQSGCFSGRLFRSSDQGVSWTEPDSSFGTIYNVPGQLDQLPGNVIICHYVDSTGSFLRRSLDNGDSWTEVLRYPKYSSQSYSLLQRSDTSYLVLDSTILISTDTAATWTDLGVNPPGSIDGNKCILLSNGTFLLKSNDSFYLSADAINWTGYGSTGMPANFSTRQFLKSAFGDTLFSVVTDYNTSELLLSSVDTGKTWFSYNAGIVFPSNPTFANGIYNMYIAPKGEKFVGVQGAAVYKQGGSTTDVTEVAMAGKDVAIYPNPAKTTVDMVLPAASQISGSYQVMNMMGACVLQGVLPAGASKATLNIGSLAPGLYIIKCSAGKWKAAASFEKL